MVLLMMRCERRAIMIDLLQASDPPTKGKVAAGVGSGSSDQTSLYLCAGEGGCFGSICILGAGCQRWRKAVASPTAAHVLRSAVTRTYDDSSFLANKYIFADELLPSRSFIIVNYALRAQHSRHTPPCSIKRQRQRQQRSSAKRIDSDLF